MTKQHILSEIKRTATTNGGAPLGVARFQEATGIRPEDWLGIHWRAWGDAVREAGYEPNTLQARRDDQDYLTRYADLTRRLGRAPTKADIKLARRADPTFPGDVSFTRRFGTYQQLRDAVVEYCGRTEGFADVPQILSSRTVSSSVRVAPDEPDPTLGYVYLVKHGARAEYKIGKTFDPMRREGEIRLSLPETIRPIHYIETDDPSGVEAYWHNRFKSQRKEGEWFALTAADVKAFKKWRRIS